MFETVALGVLALVAIWFAASLMVRQRWPLRRERQRGDFAVRHDPVFGAHVVETPPRDDWRWNW